MATGMPAPWARMPSAIPREISPTYSAWARNDCSVARTSLEVRRLTQITPTVRVTGQRDAAHE